MRSSGHVRAHRWADAMAGRVDDDERAAMARHAEDCPRCGRARDRIASVIGAGPAVAVGAGAVGAGTGTFAAIRKEPVPELGWDTIRARVHWDVSSARRSKPRIGWLARPRLRRAFVVGGFGLAGVAAAVVGVVAVGRVGGVGPWGGERIVPASVPVAATPAVEHPAALVGSVSRFAGEVMIDGIR